MRAVLEPTRTGAKFAANLSKVVLSAMLCAAQGALTTKSRW